MRKYLGPLFAVALFAAAYAADTNDGADTVKAEKNIELERRILRKVKTIYSAQGRATQRGRAAKGWHQVADSVKLAAGKAVVVLNTSTSNGRQDVSFVSKATYRGSAFSLDTLNYNSYAVIPLSGSRFMVRSGSDVDTATVFYLVEGE